jgi:hypothetical protein
MGHIFFNFAGVIATVAFSVAVAVYIEWQALRGLIGLMPVGRRIREVETPASAKTPERPFNRKRPDL